MKERLERNMNRIEEKMRTLKENGRKAFITYMTAGMPDMEGCKKIIFANEKAGCDVIELGIPFSDPVADGPVIQNASALPKPNNAKHPPHGYIHELCRRRRWGFGCRNKEPEGFL